MGEIIRKRWFQLAGVIFFILAFVFFAKFWGKGSIETAPNIVADVAGQEITKLEFDAAVNRRYMKLMATQGRVSASDRESILMNVFKEMLNDSLLRMFSGEEGVVVTGSDLQEKKQLLMRYLQPTQQEVSQYSSANSKIVTQEDKYKHLWTSLGFRTEEEFLRNLELEILEQKLMDSIFPRDSYTVTDEEVNEYIPTREMRQIFLIFDEQKPETEEINFADRKVWQRAREIYEQLMQGADFASMAKKYSQEVYASEGGYIGFVNKRSVVKKFWEVVSQMQPGDISEPFTTGHGIHILQCLNVKDPSDPMFDEMRKTSKDITYMKKQRADFDAWFYRRFRELEEKDKIVLYHPVIKANKLMNMGELDEAVDTYRKAIEIDKEGAPYYNIDIAMIYSRQKRYTEAIRELREATQKAPTDPRLFLFIGRAYMELGEHDKAMNEFDTASKLAKLDYNLHFWLEKIYTQLGFLDLADREHDLYLKAIDILGGAKKDMAAPGAMFKSSERGMPAGTDFQGVDSIRPDSEFKNLFDDQQ